MEGESGFADPTGHRLSVKGCGAAVEDGGASRSRATAARASAVMRSRSRSAAGGQAGVRPAVYLRQRAMGCLESVLRQVAVEFAGDAVHGTADGQVDSLAGRRGDEFRVLILDARPTHPAGLVCRDKQAPP